MTATECTTPEALTIQVNNVDGKALVCLGGRVTVDSSPELRSQLLLLLKQPNPPTLIIDLSDLSYIDCSGIATLIEALRIARQRHTNLQVRGVRDGPRHLLEVTGLLHLFETGGGPDHSSISRVS